MLANINQNTISHRGIKNFCELVMTFVSSNLFLKATFGWFILQGLFFAVTTRVGLPPDENYHLAFIELFTNNNFSPFINNQADYLMLGEVERTPFFLYHYLFSFFYALVGGWEHGVVALRLLNLLLGVASLLVVIKIADALKVSKAVRNLSLFMLSGTLMFVFLFASVNYDSLFILVSLLGFLFLLKVRSAFTATNVLALVLLLAVGSLIKISFLVIAVALVVGLSIKYLVSLKDTWHSFRQSFQTSKALNVTLLAAVGLLLVLVAHRYGYNVVKYHNYAPSCTQVQTVEACRQNPVFARDEMVFGEKRLTPDKDPFEYAYDWVPLIQGRTHGILAGEELSPLRLTSVWAQILVVVTAIAVARMWSRKDHALTAVLVITLFYIIVLMAENFQTYLGSGRFGFATQGRYIFAVLPILYLVGNYYIFKLFTNLYVRASYVVLSVAIFAIAGLPTYLHKTDTKWFMPKFSETTQQIKN